MNISSDFRSWYFRPKAFEEADGGRFYRRLGIRFYKRYLPTSGDLVSRRHGITRITRAHGGLRASLIRHERRTRSYETRHILGGLSMLALTWWSITFHGKGNWVVLLAANFLINGYPIMLQRYNRVRVRAALAMLALPRAGQSVPYSRELH